MLWVILKVIIKKRYIEKLSGCGRFEFWSLSLVNGEWHRFSQISSPHDLYHYVINGISLATQQTASAVRSGFMVLTDAIKVGQSCYVLVREGERGEGERKESWRDRTETKSELY